MFIVGHWSVSRKVTNHHVTSALTKLIEIKDAQIENQFFNISQKPLVLYQQLVAAFSKEGDLLVDVGSRTGKI